LLKLQRSPGYRVRGFLLTPRGEEFCETVEKFEPLNHCAKCPVEALADGEATSADCYAGKDTDQARGAWPYEPKNHRLDRRSSRDDPILTTGVSIVRRRCAEYAGNPVWSLLHDGEWERFFEAHMACLLRWSCIERFAALRRGPRLPPGDRVKGLGRGPGFASILSTHSTATPEGSIVRKF
jgi:hypothetical protein